MKPDKNEFQARYARALRNYRLRGGEGALQEAYKLGRYAVTEGMGVLDMVGVHHRAVNALVAQSRTVEEGAAQVAKAGEFFAECMSPFEMTHRAFGEANAALSRLNQTLEKEAKRIAYALHDEAGQLLAAVHIKLDEIGRELDPHVRERLQEVRELLDLIDEQLRRLSHELRPTVLDDFGLVPALEFLAGGVSKRAKLRIKVDGYKGQRLPGAVETALYRIVQEALNNVAKHAQAKSVNIRVRRTAQNVLCSVRDDGIGFNPSALASGAGNSGLGLLGMRERLNALGGGLQIISKPDAGTELQITVPIEV